MYDYFESIIDVSNTKYGQVSENCAVLTNKGQMIIFSTALKRFFIETEDRYKELDKSLQAITGKEEKME